MVSYAKRRIRALKYLSIFSIPVTMVIALTWLGNWVFLPFAYVFGLIPLIELILNTKGQNLADAEAVMAAEDPLYDWLLYATLPVQIAMLLWYIQVVDTLALFNVERVGLVLSMGIMCGTFGINVGHELGHRVKRFERVLAKSALATSLYMHFFIEHNRGHHRRVATPEDPATARLGENVFVFWVRSITFSFLSAWKLEAERLRKRKKPALTLQNEMIWFMLIQMAILTTIALVFSVSAMVHFVLASLVGILLLETVNYIEHYGLVRRRKESGKYERTLPQHSWNSNHVIGRIMLFELSRHSDHHYEASRKYQVLRHHENSPQMPTGYPGMIVMSLIPPVWFRVMHRELEKLEAEV